MFKAKILQGLQEDLQQMQLKCKRSLNIDDISYFKYFSNESILKTFGLGLEYNYSKNHYFIK